MIDFSQGNRGKIQWLKLSLVNQLDARARIISTGNKNAFIGIIVRLVQGTQGTYA
jgi:hypothetical protein